MAAGRYLRACKGVTEVVLMHSPPPKSDGDFWANEVCEILLHGCSPLGCILGVLVWLCRKRRGCGLASIVGAGKVHDPLMSRGD